MVAPVIMSLFGPLIQAYAISKIGTAMTNAWLHPWVDEYYPKLQEYADQHGYMLPNLAKPLKVWMVGYYRIATNQWDYYVPSTLATTLDIGVGKITEMSHEFDWYRDLLKEYDGDRELFKAVINNMLTHERQFPHQPFLEQYAILVTSLNDEEKILAIDAMFDLEKRHEGLIAGLFGKKTYQQLEPLVSSLRNEPYMLQLRGYYA